MQPIVNTNHLEARAATAASAWPSRVFAPYCDVLLWPTFDIATAAATIKNKHFTLAFITADGSGKAAWGGIGDVIVSFGGAIGQELALVPNNNLVAEYKSVIDMYSLTYIDFDIEGAATMDVVANTRRAKALATIKKMYPGIKISYTLPVLPSGLTSDGVEVLKNAAANGLVIDAVNIMAMDYGSGVAPNGATGMGGYAIAAAQATRAQLKPIFPSATIGITPMIGQNDVRGEIFSLQDAKQLLNFAQANSWISLLSFWSINRDTSVFSTALYASSGIKQNMFDFANIMSAYETSTPTTPVVVPSTLPTPPTPIIPVVVPSTIPTPPTPSTPPAPKIPMPNIPGVYNWPALVFAPTVDTTGPNAINLATMSNTAGTSMYNLGYMVADATNSPSWGGLHSLSDSWYLSQIQQIRNFGGDVMISFGGPKGASLLNRTSIDVRNAALRGLQTVFPNLRITYTLPATPTGLSSDAMYVLTSAYNAGVRVDVVNVLAIPANTGITLDPAVTLSTYTINAVQAAYTQAKATGLAYFSMGITPVIGTGEYAGATFSANDASQILLFARSNSWVTYVSISTANTDVAYRTTNVLRGVWVVNSIVNKSNWASHLVWTSTSNSEITTQATGSRTQCKCTEQYQSTFVDNTTGIALWELAN
ncbi:hypothetical protein BASA61_002355 [Batrachochytrium salamandrivorans]|nr:hypothetical protein BASA61_002355 [Batrachochytrium salamandrivorans]